jgi:hypothetical protein
MLNVIMLNVIMLNVIMLNVGMLNVVMLNVIMLNVVMLNVVAPSQLFFTSLTSSPTDLAIKPRMEKTTKPANTEVKELEKAWARIRKTFFSIHYLFMGKIS